jgi:pimeloyl-ACP methyl ester carboxylesterase
MTLTTMTVARLTLATGVTVDYVERGDPNGTPVVFLHGVTDSWRSFEPMLPHLPASIRAIAVTQRGHGGSSRPDTYRYVDFSADVAALLDALEIPSAVIVGHSMGSLVAQRFAIDHPDRTAGLVLLGALPTIKGHPEVQAFWDGALANLTDPVDPGIAREFQVSTLAQPIAPALLDLFVGESLKVPARVWKTTFREFLDTDFSADLGRITAPALVIWADKDGFSRRQERDALAAGIPGAIVRDYLGAGHAMHWEDPVRVAADVAGFVAGLPRRAGASQRQ